MKKIDKRTALKIVEEGGTIYLLPSKIRLENVWIKPLKVNKEFLKQCNANIEELLNVYEFYNCNREVGKTISYYIKEKGENL